MIETLEASPVALRGDTRALRGDTDTKTRNRPAAIENNAKGLQGADWFAYLEELSSHIESMMDCYKEENPEEFK